jgi:hypothetical protein
VRVILSAPMVLLYSKPAMFSSALLPVLNMQRNGWVPVIKTSQKSMSILIFGCFKNRYGTGNKEERAVFKDALI